MLRRPIILLAAFAAALAVAVMASATPGGRAASTGVVFVTSQGLYYDTFVTRDPIPMTGKFQLLENGTTEFGPGDPGSWAVGGGKTQTRMASRTPTTTTSTARCSDRAG